MPRSVSITYDYLCPFARNANETVVEMIREDVAWDVTFIPFSLTENHRQDGEVRQWDLPVGRVGSGVLALLWSIAVRDSFSNSFLAFHTELFSARHDNAADINDQTVLEAAAIAVGIDPRVIQSLVETGVPAKTLAAEHTGAVEEHGVFGVPTFIHGGEAVFVRFMDRHQSADVERVLDMLSWTNLNEFKRTSIER